jgi:leucyl/phenylalanyl-tRNA--protein transferase
MEEPPFTAELLREAYARGFFPMPHPDSGEILWFHPDPRTIIPLEDFHVSRSLRRTLRRGRFEIRVNSAFQAVMKACAERDETWITDQFIEAYTALHEAGDAHSVEVWQEDQLVGGVYGVSLAGAFFAESMFHRVTDMSKVALFHLVERMQAKGLTLLEVQFMTPHLASLGAKEISREAYLKLLGRALSKPVTFA